MDGGSKHPLAGQEGEPEEQGTPLLLFDRDHAAFRGQTTPHWIRRHPGFLVLLLVPVVVWWTYHVRQRSQLGVTEAVFPVEAADAEAGAGAPRFGAGVTLLSDTALSGAVGSAVRVHARVMGLSGRPLTDTLVRFRVVEGSGTMNPDTLRTDQEGLVHAALVLPTHPDRIVVTADVVGAQLPGVRFTVTALSGRPVQARIVSGDGQEARQGALLPRRLRVRVTDRSGAPVVGADVRFQVVGGGGAVAPAQIQTDASGYASTMWRLGDTPGAQYAAAVVPDVRDALMTFTATATAPPAEERETSPPEVPAPEPAAVTVTVSPRSFVVGGSFVCGLSGGHASCRGSDERGQRLRGSSATFFALAAGVSHACALSSTGQASCWGANESGQLGDGSRTDRSSPVEVATDARFSALTAGVSHTCGLAADGQAFCWGLNNHGQLGDGSGQDRSAPAPVSGERRFVRLVAGWNHTCGLTDAGEAYCWGLNDHGQLGDGSTQDRSAPVPVPGRFESLVAGSAHTCGIRGGRVLCWGEDGTGRRSGASISGLTRPMQVEGLPGLASRLAAGAVSTCALLASGRVYCWGRNAHGELGDGTRESRTAPVAVAGGLTFRSIFAGGALTCGFANDGAQYCWGLNQSGQLGDGTRESRAVPTRVGG